MPSKYIHVFIVGAIESIWGTALVNAHLFKEIKHSSNQIGEFREAIIESFPEGNINVEGPGPSNSRKNKGWHTRLEGIAKVAKNKKDN